MNNIYFLIIWKPYSKIAGLKILRIAGLRKPGLKIAGLRKPGLQNRRSLLRTSKGQTNKGQKTFFRKIYSGLIRDKCLKFFVIDLVKLESGSFEIYYKNINLVFMNNPEGYFLDYVYQHRAGIEDRKEGC